jgi:hypothetical protein
MRTWDHYSNQGTKIFVVHGNNLKVTIFRQPEVAVSYSCQFFLSIYNLFIRCAKSKTYMKFFFPFLFFIPKALNMRWKKLTLVFDENASFSFYGPSKFFRFADFENFFQNFLNFPKQINNIFFVINLICNKL